MHVWIDRLRNRIRALAGSEKLDAALQHGIRLHLDEQTAENVAAGMSPAEARRAAVRAFGPVSSIEEECRDTGGVAFVHNLSSDLKYTLRSLRSTAAPRGVPVRASRSLSGNSENDHRRE